MGINLTPKYMRDRNGKLMRAEDFAKRETREWGRALWQVSKELIGTGKRAVKETAQTVEQMAGKPRRRE